MKNKKNILTLLLLLFVISISFSQDNATLDEKNGFKEFTLGDTFLKWRSDLKYTHTGGGTYFYTYTGECCQQVFSYPLESVNLGFIDDKLAVIILLTEKFQTKNTLWNATGDFDSLEAKFSTLFGKPAGSKVDGGDIITGWEGRNVVLTLRYDYLGVENGDRCVILVSRRLNQNDLKDGF